MVPKNTVCPDSLYLVYDRIQSSLHMMLENKIKPVVTGLGSFSLNIYGKNLYCSSH